MKYLIKNKTYLKFIFLFLFGVLFLLPGKVHALVYKGTEFTAFESGESFSGSMTNGSKTLTSTFVSPINTNGYDWLVIPFYEFNFSTTETINGQIIANTVYCKTYTINSAYSSQSGDYEYYPTSMTCSSTASTGSSSSSLSESNGEITLTAQVFNSNNSANLCYFNQNEKQIYCQTNGLGNIKTLKIYINARGYNSINYNIEYYRLKHKYNNDATEIVNALNGVQTQQQNTITAIQNQTQQQAQQNAYVQDTSTTQAQTSTTNNITVLNDELTQNLSQFSDLTQLVVAPITMFMELNNNVCAPLTLQIPFVNQTAVLPCIKPIMTQYFGGMYSVFTTVVGAILCYWTFVKTVALIKDLVDADNDKIEVVDL